MRTLPSIHGLPFNVVIVDNINTVAGWISFFNYCCPFCFSIKKITDLEKEVDNLKSQPKGNSGDSIIQVCGLKILHEKMYNPMLLKCFGSVKVFCSFLFYS